MKDLKDYRLLKHNTFGIDVSCKRFLEYASVDEAMELTASLTEEDDPLLIIGEGSNLLLKCSQPPMDIGCCVAARVSFSTMSWLMP